MDWDFEEYLEYLNHFFLERMVDYNFMLNMLIQEKDQSGCQTVDAMTIVE